MNRLALPFAVTFTALVALTGCTSGSSGVETPTATVTDTATVTATPSAAASATPSAPAGVDGEDGGTGGPDTAEGACRTADLAGSTADDGGGAAGSVEIAIVLTNTGATSCTLQGWPGVSFVGGGDGTQIGASAKQDAASPHETVTLAPGGAARASLRVTQALNYSNAECAPRDADGFRVYPPGETESLFVESAQVACSSESVELLTVGALQAG
ncbi:DUF4232 domain-containing protein [Frigoribacterium faeni]|uniref:DUF4232 domain-containing protein n=1 Tax=Frigoribacterium faeni TaxID=145483 RepID=A0A7W3PJR5_9MICO|nr:DUF4232 domain-containing protein [Frigoribacterium faeni]MBA8814785.1 hypothetical protein [Frigoribacterium faeni]GEK83576.1 hypothetical protein FFA01_18850 [Frigoribacterium faeni]